MLSDKQIENLVLSNIPEEINFSENLVLLVKWPCIKRWRFVYPSERGYRRVHIGSYPEVSIEQALECATVMKKWIVSGLDPKIEKRDYRKRHGLWPPK